MQRTNGVQGPTRSLSPRTRCTHARHPARSWSIRVRHAERARRPHRRRRQPPPTITPPPSFCHASPCGGPSHSSSMRSGMHSLTTSSPHPPRRPDTPCSSATRPASSSRLPRLPPAGAPPGTNHLIGTILGPFSLSYPDIYPQSGHILPSSTDTHRHPHLCPTRAASELAYVTPGTSQARRTAVSLTARRARFLPRSIYRPSRPAFRCIRTSTGWPWYRRRW
jgi:hypothetical protein